MIFDGVPKDNNNFFANSHCCCILEQFRCISPLFMRQQCFSRVPHANLIGAALQQSSKFICTPALGHFKLIIALLDDCMGKREKF